MNLIFLIMKVKIDFWSIASIILNGGIYMNALTDIKSKIEKNKEEKRERLLASATALFAERNFIYYTAKACRSNKFYNSKECNINIFDI